MRASPPCPCASPGALVRDTGNCIPLDVVDLHQWYRSDWISVTLTALIVQIRTLLTNVAIVPCARHAAATCNSRPSRPGVLGLQGQLLQLQQRAGHATSLGISPFRRQMLRGQDSSGQSKPDSLPTPSGQRRDCETLSPHSSVRPIRAQIIHICKRLKRLRGHSGRDAKPRRQGGASGLLRRHTLGSLAPAPRLSPGSPSPASHPDLGRRRFLPNLSNAASRNRGFRSLREHTGDSRGTKRPAAMQSRFRPSTGVAGFRLRPARAPVARGGAAICPLVSARFPFGFNFRRGSESAGKEVGYGT